MMSVRRDPTPLQKSFFYMILKSKVREKRSKELNALREQIDAMLAPYEKESRKPSAAGLTNVKLPYEEGHAFQDRMGEESTLHPDTLSALRDFIDDELSTRGKKKMVPGKGLVEASGHADRVREMDEEALLNRRIGGTAMITPTKRQTPMSEDIRFQRRSQPTRVRVRDARAGEEVGRLPNPVGDAGRPGRIPKETDITDKSGKKIGVKARSDKDTIRVTPSHHVNVLGTDPSPDFGLEEYQHDVTDPKTGEVSTRTKVRDPVEESLREKGGKEYLEHSKIAIPAGLHGPKMYEYLRERIQQEGIDLNDLKETDWSDLANRLGKPLEEVKEQMRILEERSPREGLSMTMQPRETVTGEPWDADAGLSAANPRDRQKDWEAVLTQRRDAKRANDEENPLLAG